MLIIYNITEERDYSWINCAYNSTIFANKTEVPDSSDYSCADYHAVGYTCNDLVFIFGYDCKATCVTPTLEDDIGIDNGYGWLSLEQALIDHRDMVKDLGDSAPSYGLAARGDGYRSPDSVRRRLQDARQVCHAPSCGRRQVQDSRR